MPGRTGEGRRTRKVRTDIGISRLEHSLVAKDAVRGSRACSTWNYGPGLNMNGETSRGGNLRRRGGRRRSESTWSVERPRGRLVRELANGIGDPAPYGLAVVIVLRGESSARAALSSRALSPYRLSMRLAARQMSISGITGDRLHAWIANRLTRKLKLHAMPVTALMSIFAAQ